MSKKIDYNKLNSALVYAMWSAFRIPAGTLDGDRQAIAEQFQDFLDSYRDSGVTVRGVYDVSGLRPEADIMFWTHGEDLAALQAFYRAFRRETELGRWRSQFAPMRLYIAPQNSTALTYPISSLIRNPSVGSACIPSCVHRIGT